MNLEDIQTPTGAAVEPIASDSATLPTLPRAVAWLVDRKLVPLDEALRACVAAEGQGKDPLSYLKGKVSLADLHEAAMHARQALPVHRLADVPEWTIVLNDAGGDLGSAMRNPDLAIVANDKESGRDQLRCFILHTPAVSRPDISAAVTSIIGARYHMAGRIEVPAEVLAVLYGEWEGRGRKGYVKGASDAALHAEFDDICEAAIKLRASDIHISSTGNTGAIHVRIDGELEHFRELTAEHALALCSSVYNTLSEASSVKESFNPAKPLDSAVERPLRAGLHRFRFSSMPMAPAGFDVTLRIIPIGVIARRQSAEDLGYSPDQAHALERMFARSSGMVLFAGTTGSGKSTSMANLIWKMAEERPGKKIRTVEEPVEIVIPGAYQHPVTRMHGDKRDFLIMLRQLLRADPDVIMIGELRDGDTAEIAIQAVRSGHLCVSTIHADGAPICYDRMVGMGVSRLDMASVNLIAGLIYQKLVAVLCPHCKIPATDVDARAAGLEAERLARVRLVNGGHLDNIFVRDPTGCPRCRHRGVMGRTVCAEILRPTPQMLGAVASGDSRQLWRLWRATINRANPEDMTGRTAFEHALHKMRKGLLSPEDIEREFHFLDEAEFVEAAE